MEAHLRGGLDARRPEPVEPPLSEDDRARRAGVRQRVAEAEPRAGRLAEREVHRAADPDLESRAAPDDDRPHRSERARVDGAPDMTALDDVHDREAHRRREQRRAAGGRGEERDDRGEPGEKSAHAAILGRSGHDRNREPTDLSCGSATSWPSRTAGTVLRCPRP